MDTQISKKITIVVKTNDGIKHDFEYISDIGDNNLFLNSGYVQTLLELNNYQADKITFNIPFPTEIFEMYAELDDCSEDSIIYEKIGSFFNDSKKHILSMLSEKFNYDQPNNFIKDFFKYCESNEYCQKIIQYAISKRNLHVDCGIIYKKQNTKDYELPKFCKIKEYDIYSILTLNYPNKNKIKINEYDVDYSFTISLHNETNTLCLLLPRRNMNFLFTEDKVFMYFQNNVTLTGKIYDELNFEVSTENLVEMKNRNKSECPDDIIISTLCSYITHIGYDYDNFTEACFTNMIVNSSLYDITKYVNNDQDTFHFKTITF